MAVDVRRTLRRFQGDPAWPSVGVPYRLSPMAELPAPTSCSRCGSEVLPEDLVQGLAVRLDGSTVCPVCVDGLPVVAQVTINRLRALRGLPTTTFRVQLPRHPRTAAFTFTTAGNQLVHRRHLLRGEEFHAPLLPPVAKPAVASPLPPAGGMGRLLLGIGAGAAVAGCLVAGGLVWWTQRAPPPGSAAPATSRVQPQSPLIEPSVLPEDAPAAAVPVRSDYPVDPLQAFAAATADAACPPAVRERLVSEVQAVAARQLTSIAQMVAAGQRERAGQELITLALPDDPAFAEQRARHALLVAEQQAIPLPPVPPAQRAPVPPSAASVLVPRTTPAETPAETPTETPAAAEGSPASASAPISPMVSQIFPPLAQRLALDGSAAIPSPWPSSAIPGKDPVPLDPIFQDPVKRAVELSLPAGPAGGVLVQINATAALRAQLDGNEVGQLARPTGQRTWQWWAITLPERPAAGVLRVRTEGSGGFVLGPAVLVLGAEPTLALLRTSPPPLLCPPGFERGLAAHQRALIDGRRNPIPPFDPAAVKVLYGDDLSSMGSDLARRLGGARTDAPPKQVEDVPDFAPGWFPRLQLKAKTPLASAKQYSVLVLWPGTAAGKLAEGKQLRDIRQGLLEPDPAYRRENTLLLPVVVVGAAVAVNDAQRPALDAAYASLIAQADLLGLPVIDVRTATGRTKTAFRDDATRLLADGLANLTWHLRVLERR
jgi:hypothetical protein